MAGNIDTSAEACERLAAELCARWDDVWEFLKVREQAAATLRALAAERDAMLTPRGYVTCAHCGGQNGWIEADMAVEVERRCAAAYAERDRLAAMLAQARRDGMEEAAQEVDCGCDIREAVLARVESQGEKRASYLCPHGDVCCALQAAAIRAKVKEVRDGS